MYIEQRLRTCSTCSRPFAVRYAYMGERVPTYSIRGRAFPCPHRGCGAWNGIVMFYRVANIEVRTLPFPFFRT
jgi:hypothetical protein